ncbi:MAG: PAS-domain containing protein [Hyphomonas sp.]
MTVDTFGGYSRHDGDATGEEFEQGGVPMTIVPGETFGGSAYSTPQAAELDLVHRHPLPMALLDHDLRVLCFSDALAGFLSEPVPAGEPLIALLSALGTPVVGEEQDGAADGHERNPGDVRQIWEAIEDGEWRLPPIVSRQGRVVVPFNYQLASGYTQLVLMEPARLNETTDLGEVLEVAADAFAIFDERARLIKCNREFVSLLTADLYADPPLGQSAHDIVRQVISTGILRVAEGMDLEQMIDAVVAGLLTETGATFELEGKLGRLFIAASRPRTSGGHILTLRDVTELRDAQRRTLRTLADAIEALDQGFAQFDEQRHLVFCNQKYRDLLFAKDLAQPRPGMSNAELARISIESGRFILPEGLTDDGAVQRLEKWMIAERKGFELLLTDGTVLQCGYTRTALGGYLVTLLDVTDRRASEQRALATLRDAAGALEEGFSLWDADFNFVLCNDRYCELVFKDPSFRPQPGQPGLEISRKAAENATGAVPAGMSAEEFSDLCYTQIRNLAKHVELKLDTGRIVEFSGHRTAQGGYLITVLDVTERHRAAEEIERQTETAHQNEKLSALGELLAGVAHELNNPLSIVVGYSQLLADEIKDPKQADRIRRITRAAERSARIVKTFLAMARQKPAKMEPVDLADVIETAVDFAAYGFRTTGGRLTLRCASDLPLVLADKDQMVQVFSNLIVNAEHAMRGMGKDALLALDAARAGNRVRISITDNGIGMDTETQARIFEPFFTTKDVGSGTGFGLAFCHRIVTSHDGTLTVRSAPGTGTEFTISLPVLATWNEDESEANGQGGSGLSILVVDDEADVADLIAEILSARGHHVACAHGPAEALRAVRDIRFDIVLSDMKMPEMTGDRLLQEIVALRPELAGRIGFITGDSLSAKVREFLEADGQYFIEKPVVVDELLDLVERIRPRLLWGRR